MNAKTFALAILALLAFAANSLLNRAALADGAIDAISFTIIRLVAGALLLALLLALGQGGGRIFAARQWRGGAALFAYALCFSLAYLEMEAGMGALLLFTSVQLTMQSAALIRGHRPSAAQWVGLALALAGLFWLLGPGAAAPPPFATILMIASGVAWGVYSMLGFSSLPPVDATRSNFIWAALLALLLVPFADISTVSMQGIMLAIAAGAITSALGYVIWYTALPALGSSTAAVGQLLVPSIAALGGILFLGEALLWRLIIATLLILCGIALTMHKATTES